MRTLSDISIRTKIILASVAVLVTTVGLGTFTMQRMGVINQVAAEVRDNQLPSTAHLGRLMELMQKYRNREARHIMSSSAGEMAVETAALDTLAQDYTRERQQFQPLIDPGAEQNRFVRIDELLLMYRSLHARIVDFSDKNRNVDAAALYKN